MDTSRARWRWRISHGRSYFGPGLIQVQKLVHLLVRCPKCGEVACMPYRQPLSMSNGYRCYLKCRSCHKQTRINSRTLAALVREQAPATYQEILQPARH
jgi:hypothetical protein